MFAACFSRRCFWSPLASSPLLRAGRRTVCPVSTRSTAAATAREPYTGELAIKGQGHAFDANWRRGGGAAENGFGLLLNHVLGVAYWPNNEALDHGLGVVIYRIDGGTLDGIWLPQGVHDRAPGREVLSGAPDLTGRYQITLGRNPWGGRYTGYADLERTGDHVTVSWHLPSEVFVGSGIKIGNVLAVAYGYTHAPGDRRLLLERPAAGGRLVDRSDRLVGRRDLEAGCGRRRGTLPPAAAEHRRSMPHADRGQLVGSHRFVRERKSG